MIVSHGGMKDRGSTCKFRKALRALRNLQMDHTKVSDNLKTNFTLTLGVWYYYIILKLHLHSKSKLEVKDAYENNYTVYINTVLI